MIVGFIHSFVHLFLPYVFSMIAHILEVVFIDFNVYFIGDILGE